MAIDLGRMYGPLPLGAWLAAVGGGLGLMLYTRRQAASNAPVNPDAAPQDIGTTPGVGVGGSGQWTSLNPPANGSADTGTAPQTNDEWALQTIAKMIGSGYSPIKVNSGITKFLGQQTLDAQEEAIVSEALRRFGSPPIPVPGPYGPGAVGTPPQSARWPIPKAPFFQYTVQSGDTLSNIASHYGTTQKNLYFYNAVALDRRARLTGNKNDSRGGMYIYAGTPLTIPWGLPGQHYTA